jgi:2-amino-4-hydroxy-6-hydroxymethyldihydropteridine diphosphokinase
MTHDFVIGLGSNLGDRGGYIAQGVERIAAIPHVRVAALSPVYETEPIGPAQPRYLNAALRADTELAAELLLEHLLAIERELGRIRTLRWGPRVLDLDILWASEPHSSERLTVPHAHLTQRAFALAPLLDVAPELAARYAAALREAGGVPQRHGELAFDAARGACAYNALRAV